MGMAGLSKSRLERMHQVLNGYVERIYPVWLRLSVITTTCMWKRSAPWRSATPPQ